jgi:hypothetical protein
MRFVVITCLASFLFGGCTSEQPLPAKEHEATNVSDRQQIIRPSSAQPTAAITIEEALEDARLLILADNSVFSEESKELIERRYKHRPFWEELNIVVSIMNMRRVSGAYAVALKDGEKWQVLMLTDTPAGKLPKPDKLYYSKEHVGRRAIWYPADNEGRPIR